MSGTGFAARPLDVDRPLRFGHPAVIVAVLLPVVTPVLFLTAQEPRSWPLTLGVLAAAVTIATVLLLGVERAGRLKGWHGLLALLALPWYPVLLVGGLGVPVAGFSLAFLLLIAVAGFLLPGGLRRAFVGLTVAVWTVTLLAGGVREPDLLLLHLGGGAIVVGVVAWATGVLQRTIDSELAVRQQAEARAELLSRLLHVHRLDRREVIDTILGAAREAGLDVATLRSPVGDVLVLERQWRAPSLGGTGPRIEQEVRLARLAIAEGRLVRLDELPDDEWPAPDGPALADAMAVPLWAGTTIVAVLAGGTVEQPLTPAQRETMRLLGEATGQALHRAAAYSADERTVERLADLEGRTRDFISTVSHELRTPLTVVQGVSGMLAARWDELRPERRADLLRRVDANAVRLGDMVRSLLDTSAWAQGEIRVAPRRVGLAALVGEVVERLGDALASHRVTVDVPDDATAWADPSLLAHVLENLLTNAARHTPQGTRVRVDARRRDDQVELAVTDDGPGIAREDLPHVLERFYRGGEPDRRPPGGLGLGLALAQQVLAAHGSHLRLASEPGRGTRFSFVLPTVPGEPHQ